jgi:hypothetical protein
MLAELDEEIPMPPAGRDQDCSWTLDEVLTECNRRFHWRRRIEDLGVGDADYG